MTPPVPTRRIAGRRLLLALIVTLGAATRARAEDPPARQVTLFGIVANPADPAIDPKLAPIQAQLRKLLPGHGFKLLDVQSRRLVAGQTVTAQLGQGYIAETTLVRPLDENGKVELRCALFLNLAPQLETLVATPPNQLFFCDKLLPDGSHLLLGVGAR